MKRKQKARKPVETKSDFKDRIAAKIRGVSVETYILTRKLKQQEAYRKLVTRTKEDREAEKKIYNKKKKKKGTK